MKSLFQNWGVLAAVWLVVLTALAATLGLAFLQAPPPPPTAEPATAVLAPLDPTGELAQAAPDGTTEMSEPAPEAATAEPGHGTAESPAAGEHGEEAAMPAAPADAGDGHAPEGHGSDSQGTDHAAEAAVQEAPVTEGHAPEGPAPEGHALEGQAAEAHTAPPAEPAEAHTPAEAEAPQTAALPAAQPATPEAHGEAPAPEKPAQETPAPAEPAHAEAAHAEPTHAEPAPAGHAAAEPAPAAHAPAADSHAPQGQAAEGHGTDSHGTGEQAAGGHDQVAAIPVIPPAPELLPYWQRYRQPFNTEDTRPRIAVVLTGLGLSDSATEAAINKLPPAITLSFSPYARNLERWIALARGRGHEVMIDLPMEPATFPNEDPGPQGLLTTLSADKNLDRLDWVLSRGSAYVGVAGAMGSRFTASRNALEPVLKEVKGRGLIFLDRRTTEHSLVAELGAEMELPVALNNRSVDERQASRVAIDARLAQIERIALTDGYAVAMAQPYPVTLDRLAEWATELNARGLVIAPISALVGHQKMP